ncbi:MAG TPA: carbohydrate-binding protein [Kiritimatiellia bacterium]|nr:carbohydrate-binding protein [Kiritimatiellia bacterium]HMP34048.1 carbohydrate-binding protein [Kiritimatiellia bacterium]
MKPYLILAATMFVAAVASGYTFRYETPVRATWTESSDRSVTLSWDRRIAGRGTVRYGVTTNYTHQQSNGGGVAFHAITLRDLTPDTRYFYEVSSSDGWSRTGSFRTAPRAGDPLHFVIHGDLFGSVNETYAREVADIIVSEDPQFVTGLGDLAFEDFTGTGFDTWEPFFRTCSNLLSSRVYMPTLGGHDCAPGDASGKDCASAVYNRLFPLPEPSIGLGYYSYTAGSIRFISLNTEVPGIQLTDWLARELQAAVNDTNITWIMALSHHPPYSWGFRPGTEDYRIHWTPLLTRYEANWMASGHSHNYQRTVPIDGVRYLVAGGGGGQLYASAVNEPLHAFATSCFHYVSCHITGSVMQLRAIRSDGLLFDSVTVTNTRHVRVEPAFPLRGQAATVTYRAPSGPLQHATNVLLHWGVDGFTEAEGSVPMAWNAATAAWEHTLVVPATATQRIAFVFHDGNGTWHNNHNQNWQALLDRASLFPANPSAGDSVTLRYEADQGPLAAAASITAWVAINGPAHTATNLVTLTLTGPGQRWEGSLALPDHAERIAVSFMGDGVRDNNSQRNWSFPVADPVAVRWPAAPVAAVGSPDITPNPPGELPDNIGDNVDLALLGPPLPVQDAPIGFGAFGSIWVNVDATNLYLGGYGADLGGSNNVIILFVGLDTLNDNAWNLWHKSGKPNALDFLHNLTFTAPMDIAIVLGDSFGDGPSYPDFSMGGTGGYNHGMGIFYIGTNAGSFVAMSAAKLSQFHGTGTVATTTQGTPAFRRTQRWEAALPWNSMNASGPHAISNLFIGGVIGSASVQGNNRYLSREVLGERAWGLVDQHRQHAFYPVTVRPAQVHLLHGDVRGDGISNRWRLDHFGTPDGPRADVDSDGDSQSNGEEFMAGTHPADPASRFTLQWVAAAGSEPARLQWPFLASRRYDLGYTADLHAPFAPLATGLHTNVFPVSQPGYYTITVRSP